MAERELDRIDQRIVAELTANARLPVLTLSRRVGLSRTAVQNRLERLERDGVIKGYTLKLGETAERSPQVGALVMVSLKDRLGNIQIIELLEEVDEVMHCLNVSGDMDLTVILSETSQARLQEICKMLWEHPNVRETHTQFVLGSPISR